MKKMSVLALFICAVIPLRIVSQESGKSNSFVVPSAQKQAKPAELKVNLTFKDPSGNGILNPEETGQLTVTVVNTGETAAKDVRVKLSSTSRFDGVTFPKELSLGDVNPSESKTKVVSLVAGKTLANQKTTISAEATEAATKKTFAATIPVETAPLAQVQNQTVEQVKPFDSQQDFNFQSTPSNKLSPAIRQLRDKLNLDPNDNLTRLQLTQLLFNEKLYSDAIIEGEKALSTFQDRPSLYYQVGESYRQFKKYTEALRLLDRAYKLTNAPFTDLSASYALTLLHLGKVQDATPVLRKAATGDPTFLTKRLNAANAEFKANDMEAAADEYFAVMIIDRAKLTPDQQLFVQFNVDFKSFIESKDPAAATSAFVDNIRKKLGDKLDYDELAAAFTAMVATKQLDQARNLYNETLKLPSEAVNQDTLDKKFLAIAYNLSNDSPDLLNKVRIAFIRTIKSQYDLSEEDAKPTYALHEFVLKQGLLNAASEITSSLISTPVHRLTRYVQLAGAFLKYRKNDDAVGTFRMMLVKKGLDKLYPVELTQLYSTLLQNQKREEAQDLMRQINALNESDLNATYSKIADIFTKAGQPDKSINILQKLIQNDPNNVALSIKLGDAFFAKGRYDDIISSFANVKTKEGRKYLAQAHEKKLMLAEANKTWEEIRKMTSDPKEIAEAKKHIDDNLITMMNPDFAKMQADVNRPKPAPERMRIVIDSPRDGFQTASSSVDVTGKILGAVSLQDVRINGRSVGTDRGMKVAEAQPQQQDASNGLPFAYVVSLAKGRNDIKLEAVAANGDSVQAKITVTMATTVAEVKPMTIEEADGIRQTKAYAVIIGVAKYQDPGIKSLNYTVNDAEELAKVLIDPAYGGFKKENVIVLKDAEATTRNIKRAIGVDLKRAPEDGIAFVFFAGHGAPEGEKTYWLTYDSDPTSLYASALSNDEIADMLGRINTKRVVTFLDCCYSGASITSTKSTRAVLIDDPFKSFEGEGRITITSSNGKEQSLEDPKLKHGIFTYRLLEAIKGKADLNGDGIVMADEIARYIKETVPNDARERSHKQDPVVDSRYTGFIPVSRNAENVLKNSRIIQVQHFMGLYRDGKIDGAAYKKIKDILDGNDDASKKPIKDYFDKVLTLKDLLDFIGK